MIKPTVFLFLDFGGGEIMIILLVILIVLGPDKIPTFAKEAGKILRYVRNATDDIKREINKETEEIQAPIKSAYQSASSFSENAHKAMKTTLKEIEMEADLKKKEPTTEEKAESNTENKKNEDNTAAKQ